MINDPQQAAWQKSIDIFEGGQSQPRTVALFPEDRVVELADPEMVRIQLAELQRRPPRQWGACWLACHWYEERPLDGLGAERLKPSRKGTRWDLGLQTRWACRLIDPGSEWRLHRQWFASSAMADWLGADFAPWAEAHKLSTCHAFILKHQRAPFDPLTARGRDWFNAKFEVRLYDLPRPYCESDPPFPEGDKRKHGYSRDKRPDCVPGHRADRHAGRLAIGLRSNGWQSQRQEHLERVSGED